MIEEDELNLGFEDEEEESPESIRQRELLEIAEELRIATARDSFSRYVKETNEGYTPGWFNALLCLELEQFYKDYEAGKNPRLMIFAPPRSGKSELASRRFPAWAMGRNNRLKVIACSYAAELAETMSRDVRRILTEKKHRRIFPNALIDTSPNATNRADMWGVCDSIGRNTGGSYRCAGVGGGLTGQGANILIIDDPVKDAREAGSKIIQKRHLEWYSSTFLTRRDPLKNGIVIISTRWHKNDLCGQLLEEAKNGGEQWRVLKFPMIATEDEEHRLGNRVFRPRKKGDILFPERMPPDYVDACKKSIPMVWSALFQQSPVIEGGGIIPTGLFGRYTHLPPMRRVVAACDTALTTKTSSDYSVFQLWGECLQGKAYLIDQIRGKWEAPMLLKHARAFWDRHRNTEYGPAVVLQAIHIEEAAAGYGLMQQLRSDGVPVIGLPTVKDKYSRVLEMTVPLSAGLILLPSEAPWVNEFLQEAAEFTADDSHLHDDMVDTACYGIELLLGSNCGGKNRYSAWADFKIW